ncbi:hypothetical protein FFR93_29330 [Rhizobium sp. MHM7A]|nr:hypothetical protein FFR93_29330 [Rhizobium sp. MHM7A]
MKQTGEVYQAKSAMGNARKRENCIAGMPRPARLGPAQDPTPREGEANLAHCIVPRSKLSADETVKGC